MVDPVGRSFEVVAHDEASAERNARERARMIDAQFGRVLWTEQIEAGVWEVVLEELADEPVALRFFRFLLANTDTFDPVMVRLALDGGTFPPDEDQMRSLVVAFEEAEGRPAPFSDPYSHEALSGLFARRSMEEAGA